MLLGAFAVERILRSTLALASGLLLVACQGESTGPRPPTRLVFTAQPAAVIAGTAISPVVQVAVKDDQGNTVTTSTASITVAIADGAGASGAVLGGTLTRSAAGGVATFDDLTIDKAGSGYALSAMATSLTGTASTPFTVSPGAPMRLAFTTQPTSVGAGANISPAVRVAVKDAQGNTVTTSTAGITVAIAVGAGNSSALLDGTLTRPAADGVATFDDLTIDMTGSDYTLTVRAPNLTGATSNSFSVLVPSSPRKIAFLSDADGTLQVYVADANGTNIRQLTKGTNWGIDGGFYSDFDQLAASHDGTRLALAGPGIAVINSSDGSDFTFVSQDGLGLAWAPTDSVIRFVRISGDVWNVRPDGSGTISVGPIALRPRIAWSPDLSMITYQRTTNFFTTVYVANADGGNERLLDRTNWASGAPAWSPDGREIAWWNSGYGIVRMNSDGSGSLKLLIAEDIFGPRHVDIHTELSWSPDGAYLAFSGHESTGTRAIWVIDVAGANGPVRISPAGFNAWAPTWLR